MATNKNFTMQQYNGTDYDVLYPKNTSQQTLLNDSTLATALGLTATNPEIDQALTEIVSKITALEDGAVKIQTGSYVGTGTYGASNPCSLTFDFVPEFVIVLYEALFDSTGSSSAFGGTGLLALQGQTKFLCSVEGNNGSGKTYKTLSWNGQSVSWYGSSAYSQANVSDLTYRYIGLMLV